MFHHAIATVTLTVLSVTAVVTTPPTQNGPETRETTTQSIQVAPKEETKQEAPTKEEIVADVTDKEEKLPKYTLRVGLDGKRKPIAPLTGATEEERAQEFLTRYKMGDTYTVWKRESDNRGIDITLPICIAFSDSHLGGALSTSYNLGNVGNNDRGDRVHMKSWEQGIVAIYSTLQNRWIGGSPTVGYLSGEGRIRAGLNDCNNTNTNQKCYATSATHWSTNVVNCMSTIKQAQIDESFSFRTF